MRFVQKVLTVAIIFISVYFLYSKKAMAFAPIPGVCGTACLSAKYFPDNSPVQYFVFALIFSVTFLLAASILGWLVKNRDWPVGYTRKILALILFLLPMITVYSKIYFLTYGALSTSALVYIFCIAVLSQPVRKRFPFLSLPFAAIDRPEDRPHTIYWLLTALAAMWLVMILWITFLPLYFLPVAMIVIGLGDTLAEPVGLKFGRHKYETRAIGTDKKYIRTLEGSACLFFSAFAGIIYANWGTGSTVRLSNGEALACMALFAPIVTWVEAKSPHTWDQPFLALSCGVLGALFAVLTGRMDLFPWSYLGFEHYLTYVARW